MKHSGLRAARCAAVLAALLAVGVPTAAAVTGAQSFRNSRALVPDAQAAATLTLARLACFPSNPLARPPKKLTFSKALQRAGSLVGTSRSRYKTLRKQKLVKTSVGGERLAAAAMLKGSSKGALAALLAARSVHPKDPLLLIDASVALLNLGRPAEALAFLDRAKQLKQRRLASHGLSTSAVLYANRAAALVALQRFSAAATDARRALRSSAWLVEARETLATALVCMNKPTEALCEFRAAMKRPLEPGQERLSCVGVRRTPNDQDMGDFTTGKEGVFPPIGYPSLAEKAEGYPEYYNALTTALNAKSDARAARQQALAPAHSAFFETKSPAEIFRTSDLRNAINLIAGSPASQAVLAQGHALQTQIDALAVEDAEKTRLAILDCAGQPNPDQCVHDKCNPVVLQNHGVWLNRQTQLEALYRNHWKTTRKRMDAILQNIADPVENELAAADIDTYGDALWALIIDGATPMVATEFSLKTVCVDPIPEPPTEDAAAPEQVNPNPCPPALEKLSVGGDIGKGLIQESLPGENVSFGWSVNCSEAEVSGEWGPLPLLVGFGKLSQSFRDGSATVVMGSKAKGPFGLEFTSELHLTVGRDGSIQDAGWRVGPKGPFGKSDIVDIPFVKSAAPPGALPVFGGAA